MSNKTVEALFLGDICGKPGARALFIGLRQVIRKYNIDIVVANGENAADGFGIMPGDADQILSAGVDVITSGNHVWQKDEILGRLVSDQRLLRPANYPAQVPGHGLTVLEKGGIPFAVINLQGRVSMPNTDCPFRTADELLKQVPGKVKVILIDFHAESAEEKEALALYLDGRASVVVGTHTHVQTADERILPGGTGYMTDLGMTGSAMSVIGSDPGISIQRQLTQIPMKSEICDTEEMINGLIAGIDPATGRTVRLKRLNTYLGV